MNPVRTIMFKLAFASLLVMAGCSTTGMDRTPSTQEPIAEPNTAPHAASPPTSPAEIAAHARDAVVTVTAFSDGSESPRFSRRQFRLSQAAMADPFCWR